MDVEYIDHMGSDERVVDAARVSFDKEATNYTEEQNRALIHYLAKHGHWTPFSAPQITLRLTVPIFVARQDFKHQIGFTRNEVSRRYVDDTPEFFVPDEWRIRPEGSVKQGSGTGKLPQPDFQQGFCIQCGVEVSQSKRHQGGGRTKKYCSTQCKSTFTNRNRNPYKNIFNNAKARATREGKTWELDFDSFEFPEYCPYLGLKLDYSQGKEKIQPNSPSFDRKNPSLGYVSGNVEIISHKANSMKNNATPDELVKMAEAVLLRHRGYIPNYEHSYEGVCKKAVRLYNDMVADGYSPEQARMVLPQSMYTSYYTTGSLAAWARAYNLRVDAHAQKEIQDLYKQVGEIIEPLFPVSWKALTETKTPS